MATKGMVVFRSNGEDFTINDPNIADEFSSSAAYSVGDYCYYQGNLYCFKNDHAAGSWSSSDAEMVRVGSKIKENAENNQFTSGIIESEALTKQRLISLYGNMMPFYVKRLEGKRANTLNGKFYPTDQSGSLCLIFPVKENTGYYCQNMQYIVPLAEDMLTVTGETIHNVGGINTPAGTVYIAASFDTDSHPENTMSVYKEGDVGTNSGTIEIDRMRLTQDQQKYLTSNLYQSGWELGDIRTVDGKESDSSTTLRTKEFCPVYPETYTIDCKSMNLNVNLCYVYQYDIKKAYCGSGVIITTKNGIPFTLASNCRFIKIVLMSSYGTTYNNDIFILQNGGLSRNIVDMYLKQQPDVSGIIVVDIEGRGDFTGLRPAVMNCKNGDVIFVRRGTYNNEEVEAWEKDITIIGESPYNTIIQNETDAYATPPLEMSAGAIYNMTFRAIAHESAKKAYALHIDNDYQEGRTFYAENCIFISDDGPAAVGAGSRRNHRQVYKNCIFINQTNEPAFFGNEATNQQTAGVENNQYYQFYNCTFKTPNAHDHVVIMRGMKAVGNTVWCTFVDCAFMDDGTTEHPEFRMDYTNRQYIGSATEMGDMGLINWYLDSISSGNTIPDLNRCREGVIRYYGPIGS